MAAGSMMAWLVILLIRVALVGALIVLAPGRARQPREMTGRSLIE